MKKYFPSWHWIVLYVLIAAFAAVIVAGLAIIAVPSSTDMSQRLETGLGIIAMGGFVSFVLFLLLYFETLKHR